MLSRILLALMAITMLDGPRPFTITVVDDQTGRGVPLVELRTVNEQIFVTDSNGVVAFAEPGLMGESVFFHVRSHGHEFPKDGFGYRGKALQVEEGGAAELKIHRVNVAERLYRVTGGGIYRDSALVGKAVPIEQPQLNARVLGSDSVVNALYKGRLRWFWGDTNRPGYPLGNFHVPGAVSRLPEDGGLDPDRGVDLAYLPGPDGFAKPTCKMPGDGPTWITGLTVLRDPADGRERMFAAYAKIRNFLEAYERGFVEWDDEAEEFRKLKTFPLKPPAMPDGHPFLYKDGGVEYVYFATPFPHTRVPATPEAFLDLDQYETFTCLVPGGSLERPEIDRDPSGGPRYAWRKGTPAVGPGDQKKLIDSGDLNPEAAWLQLRDVETGKPVTAHSGSVAWNPDRGRWMLVTVEAGGGPSYLGEVWYAEADTPLGPWAYARKVVTHDKYTFYNPKLHPYFNESKGRLVYFEGTYANTFSGNPVQTPRYDYNQLMYRLDLDDPRLHLPVAVRAGSDGPPDRFRVGDPSADGPIAFFAPDGPAPGTVPVYAVRADGDRPALVVGDGRTAPPGSDGPPLFHALPSDAASPPASSTPLYEFLGESGRRAYSVDPGWSAPGFRRAERPIGLVWKDPWGGREPFAGGRGPEALP